MALTLPYPSMNFVPLDVLTAAEQNQLVANIEYIANQFPLATTNIANGAITSAKIDWTTATSTVVTPATNFGFGTIANSRTMHIWNFGSIVMLQGQIQTTQAIATGYTDICTFSTDYNPVGGGTLTFMDTTSSSQPIRFDVSNGHLYSADRAYSNGEIVRLSLVWHK